MSFRTRVILICIFMVAVVGVSYWYMKITTGLVEEEEVKTGACVTISWQYLFAMTATAGQLGSTEQSLLQLTEARNGITRTAESGVTW